MSVRRIVLVFVILIVASAAVGADAPLRQWSDRTGQFSVQARLVEQDRDSVTLVTADEQRIEVPLEKLCDADRAYLTEAASPRYGDTFTLTSQLGVEVFAQDGPCRNLICGFPLPLEWPEQKVTILDREIPPNPADTGLEGDLVRCP